MFIENIICIREVDALNNTISWTLTSNKTHGIKNLKIGDNTISLMAYPIQKKAFIETSCEFTLLSNEKAHLCHQGKTELIYTMEQYLYEHSTY